ncbi:hypothetical protein IU487_09805 [Nocardia puris]|nr:hypothetical protein [Nocardia puris]
MGTVGAGRWDLVFPSGEPERVADMLGAAVIADAVRRYDADMAQWVETCGNWSRQYRAVFRAMTALAASSPAASAGIASEGLRAARHLLRFVSGYSVRPLSEVSLTETDAEELDSGTVEGRAKSPGRLEVPYHGETLTEDTLLRALTEWRRGGLVEPGFAAAVERVIDHPEWLSLSGFRVVIAGASELAPVRPLLRWGADVLAIARPAPARWRELTEWAAESAGTLRHPVTDGPGADLVTRLPALARWLRGQFTDDARPVFGGYVTRRGPGAVRLAAALDALATDLLGARSDAALIGLGAPTDSYAVPETVVAQAHTKLHGRGARGVAQDVLRILTGSALYQPNYGTHCTDAEGATWSVADALTSLQGPNYALAQRILRWRATLARHDGHTVSYPVAPLTWTRAARGNSGLSAVYRVAPRFGLEVFEPETAGTLLAAKVVADLHAPPPDEANPESLFATGAAHGGLWHLPFEPRSVFPVALLTGRVRALTGH